MLPRLAVTALTPGAATTSMHNSATTAGPDSPAHMKMRGLHEAVLNRQKGKKKPAQAGFFLPNALQ